LRVGHPESTGSSGIALGKQAQFVFRNGVFLGNFWLTAIQADKNLWKNENEGAVDVPRMDGDFCREFPLPFCPTQRTRHGAPLSTPENIPR
jgi:hypothetical protein